MGGFQVLVPVFILRLEDGDAGISPLMENFCQPSTGLDARFVVVQAEEDVPEIRILLQHPEHGVFAGPAEGGVAVSLPIFLVQREEGQQINGSLEDVEAVAGPAVVEAVPSVAAAHVPLEARSLAVQAPFVGVAGNAVFIQSDEYGIVIGIAAFGRFAALIDQLGVYESVQHRAADEALLEQVGIDPAHGIVFRWELELLLFLLFGRRGADFSLLSVQEACHRLRVAEAVELLDEGYRPAALLCGVVKPLVSPDGDAVVAGEALFPAAGQELLALTQQKRLQVYGGGPLFLIFGKFGIGHKEPPGAKKPPLDEAAFSSYFLSDFDTSSSIPPRICSRSYPSPRSRMPA